jgi:hypothetical protein
VYVACILIHDSLFWLIIVIPYGWELNLHYRSTFSYCCSSGGKIKIWIHLYWSILDWIYISLNTMKEWFFL